MNKNKDSIYDTVKKGLNIPLETEAFTELIDMINSVLATIVQLGIGPEEGFEITGMYETWEDFLGEDDKRKNMVKSLIIEKVKKIFDPVENATVSKCRDEYIRELETRLFLLNENDKKFIQNIEVSKIDEFTYLLEIDNLDYAKGKKWIEQMYKPSSALCSSAKFGNYFARNLDFYYNWEVDFIVRTKSAGKKHATLGVASAIPELTKQFMESNKSTDLFGLVPFAIVDGINDCGLFVNTNVVKAEKGFTTGTKPLLYAKESICMNMLPRYILDNFDSAIDAVNYIKNFVSVYANKKLWNSDMEAHFMIGDDSHCYCMEFVDNEIKITETNKLTNFFLYDVKLNSDGTVYTPETKDQYHDAIRTNKITKYGQGLERWNEMVLFEKGNINLNTLIKFMTDTINYNKSYTKNEGIWYTEFTGINSKNDLTVTSKLEDFDYILGKSREIYSKRSRNDDRNGVWHTTHTSIYDIRSKTLYFFDSSENLQMHTLFLH